MSSLACGVTSHDWVTVWAAAQKSTEQETDIYNSDVSIRSALVCQKVSGDSVLLDALAGRLLFAVCLEYKWSNID